jgi:NADP-reducing hydrogenase subunit HndD
MLFTIQVNNKKIKAEKGETILSALNRNGIIIPTLCRMKDFTPTGACRMCVVEVEGRDRLVTACSQPVEEWMKIKTHSPRVIQARKTIVELLLSNHPDDCLYCDRNLNCELQRLSEELNIRERRIRGRKIKPRLDQSSPAIVRELSKCILCGRCIRVCEEVITSTSLDFIIRAERHMLVQQWTGISTSPAVFIAASAYWFVLPGHFMKNIISLRSRIISINLIL